MHDDLKLADSWLAGSTRARSRFAQRFGHEISLTFEHSADARALGLDAEHFRDAVARAASIALLGSVPIDPEGAQLGPHVRRVLSHRDFVLARGLASGAPRAAGLFRERFGDYLRQLFVRSGCTPMEAERLLEEFVRTLGPGPNGVVAEIDEYSGRCDLVHWIYTYVRTRFRGGITPAAQPEVRATTQRLRVVDLKSQAQDVDLDRDALRHDLREVAAEVFSRLGDADRQLIDGLAVGTSVMDHLPNEDHTESRSGVFRRPLEPASLLARHAEILCSLHERILKRLGKRWNQRPLVAEDRMAEVLLSAIDRDLEGIFGESMDDTESRA
ncbi:MAG: hypothetical protein KDB53_20090 [Planctomycetes bacterium]|nr:hypothetical protein [Planctomycetota bacterium]